MDMVVRHSLALGNGILTVEDKRQAQARARVAGRDKGGHAARAALAMIELRRDLLLHRHPGR
jgi:6,7-dimethyl-8-ribityllumazine synthase